MARVVTVGTKVDPETKDRLEALAEERGTTTSALLRAQIDALLVGDDVSHTA